MREAEKPVASEPALDSMQLQQYDLSWPNPFIVQHDPLQRHQEILSQSPLQAQKQQPSPTPTRRQQQQPAHGIGIIYGRNGQPLLLPDDRVLFLSPQQQAQQEMLR